MIGTAPKTGKTDVYDEAFIYIFTGLIVVFVVAWLWGVHRLVQATAELEALEPHETPKEPPQ